MGNSGTSENDYLELNQFKEKTASPRPKGQVKSKHGLVLMKIKEYNTAGLSEMKIFCLPCCRHPFVSGLK